MLAYLVVALFQLPASAAAPQAQAAGVDSAAMADSTPGERRRARRAKRPPKRAEVTAQHLASAYGDSAARGILLLARAARMRQDSSLQSYDATTYQRISAGLGLSRIGRDRLAYRGENATHVRWRRGTGAYVEVTGARSVMPIVGTSGKVSMNGDISPIPYQPGSETLWIGSSAATVSVNENEGIIHPLAEGAEAYYTYESGDSVTFRLPGGKSILLRELRVRPREPKWNLAVGSLWFDMSGGQLVRAAYRMAVPMDIVAVAESDDPKAFADVPALIKPLMFPMTAQVSAIGIEYGLFQGRFWLPRLQVAEGGAKMGMLRVPFKLEQKYEYTDVNAGAALAPIVVAPADSGRGRREENHVQISVGVGGEHKLSARDSARVARRAERLRCDSTGTRSYTRTSEGGINPVRVTVTCDLEKLAHSPDLPPSIYDTGDETFSSAELDALVAEALSMGAQSRFAPQPLRSGFDSPRYNRIEGLSLGVRADQVLGAGYSVSAAGRIGLADREPNVELTGARSDLRRTLSLTAYNRLVSANDWGNPFSLGRSLNAFVFARDEGYYYRASGVELGSRPDEATVSAWSWGVFAEQQRTARVRTNFSLARALNGIGFDTNLVATREPVLGARTRLTQSYGVDPQAFRLFGDARLEGAGGRESGLYGRAALDLTASHGIGNGSAALTVAGGSSLGTLPAQRYWYLGGSQTVRGQRPGTSDGNAFWLTRAEAAYGLGVVRPAVFADLGWAGDRAHWREVGRPLSGAGVGATVLDGLLRFDLARGIYPEKRWRVETYVEARF